MKKKNQLFSEISFPNARGKIILTRLPGINNKNKFCKKTLGCTLGALKTKNCSNLISLLEEKEIAQVCELDFFFSKLAEYDMTYQFLPIKDRDIPNSYFLKKWNQLSIQLRNELKSGFSICFHCFAGIGRSGMIAALLLIDNGEKPQKAIEIVREQRIGAIETIAQETFVLNY